MPSERPTSDDTAANRSGGVARSGGSSYGRSSVRGSERARARHLAHNGISSIENSGAPGRGPYGLQSRSISAFRSEYRTASSPRLSSLRQDEGSRRPAVERIAVTRLAQDRIRDHRLYGALQGNLPRLSAKDEGDASLESQEAVAAFPRLARRVVFGTNVPPSVQEIPLWLCDFLHFLLLMRRGSSSRSRLSYKTSRPPSCC